MEKEKILIKNEFIATDDTLEIINPYSIKTVKEVYKTKPEHINEALDYLTSVFHKYKNTPAYLKSELLQAVTNKIKERKELLANVLHLKQVNQ
jgi:acyl-CoA reductase-like NAD-dependent aldehyde dehydrogenase